MYATLLPKKLTTSWVELSVTRRTKEAKSCSVSCPTVSTGSFPFEKRATFYKKKSVRPFYENVTKNLKRIEQIFLFRK